MRVKLAERGEKCTAIWSRLGRVGPRKCRRIAVVATEFGARFCKECWPKVKLSREPTIEQLRKEAADATTPAP